MKKLDYGYVRCSDVKQNEKRQIQALHDYGLTDDCIFIEKESGKTKGNERPQFSVLRKCLREGDCLVVDALDRLGRTKNDILEQVRYFKNKKVRLVILSLPTTTIKPEEGQEWVIDMVSNLLIEVYASMAEQELVEKERRTKAGIEIAKAEGKYKGRKPIEYDEEKLAKLYPRWKSKAIKTNEFQQLLNLKPNTFYRAISRYEGSLTN